MSLSLILKTLVKVEKHNLVRRYAQKPRLNFSDPSVINYFKYLIVEHETLYSKPNKTLEEKSRLFEIKPIVSVLEQRVALYDSIESLKALNKKETDKELVKMIKEEAEIYLKRLSQTDSDLLTALTKPILSKGGVLLEITAGAGGQEAMLFAKELLDMYHDYAKYKEWQVDIASLEKSDIGGLRKGSMLISGYGVPEMMMIEAGVHRVQRIPATEKGGRIHTSTVSVAVLPQPREIDLEISERDLVIETKRASGAGGQHVNTTDSAVRILHTPSGTVVECQEGRSQIKNKQIALRKLKTLLLEKQIRDQTSRVNEQRRSQPESTICSSVNEEPSKVPLEIGNSNRNEKIRTYNYPQDRVSEHREGCDTTYNLKKFMSGGESLEQLQEELLTNQRHKKFLKEIESFTNSNH